MNTAIRLPDPATAPRQPAFLTPGSLYCGSGQAIVSTVLGSCIAVCLLDRHHRAAGMNHFALPLNPSGEVSLRYGDVALERLRDRMLRLGCDAGDLRAKVFGGAAVLPFGDACDTVGAKNIAVAINWLRENSIPVIARRTGGKHGLLIRLHTDSGVVLVRKIATAPLPDSSGPVSVYDSRASPGEAIMGKPGLDT